MYASDYNQYQFLKNMKLQPSAGHTSRENTKSLVFPYLVSTDVVSGVVPTIFYKFKHFFTEYFCQSPIPKPYPNTEPINS